MFENQDIIKSFPSRQDYISNKETQFNVGGVDLNLDDIYQIKQTNQFFENPELKNLIQGLQMDNMIKLFNGEK